MSVERIDAHIHLWDYDPSTSLNKGQYDWMLNLPEASRPVLQRGFSPKDLASALAGAGGVRAWSGGAIAVQARQSEAETLFLLRLAEAQPSLIRGVVGWVDLLAGGKSVAAALAATVPAGSGAAAHPLLVGVRHIAEDEADAGWLARDEVAEGIAAVGAAGLAYDLLVRSPAQMRAAAVLATRLPTVRFVLDHIAKPPIAGATAGAAGAAAVVADWTAAIRALAKLPNVWCKISGMVTEATWGDTDESHFAPFLDVVCEAFGPSRLMLGSDWPVCLLSTTHDAAMNISENYVRGHFSAEQAAAIFGGNAAAFYRLPPATSQ